MYYLIGEGKVGSALKKHFNKKKLPLEIFDMNSHTAIDGVLFLAVPDDVLPELHDRISENFSNINIIHFSAGSDKSDMNLLHPYCSITPDTDLTEVTFTLWSKTPEKIEDHLRASCLNYVSARATPSPLYHASAVISGNFAQFFTLAATELLKKEGFSDNDAFMLLDQLMNSSIKNSRLGIKGISGPASRGDMGTVLMETEALADLSPEIAEIFKNINKMIKKAVDDGTIF